MPCAGTESFARARVVGAGREKQVADSPIRPPFEKSALSLTDISIHRLSSAKVRVWWWGSGVVVGFQGATHFF
jgi:hypothetical protein